MHSQASIADPPSMAGEFYSPEELRRVFGSVGESVTVHRSVQLFSPRLIHIGSDVRIDCFSLLSAGEQGIRIEDHVHLAAGVYLFGSGGEIHLESFSGISSRVSVYTATDEYSKACLTGPTVPLKYRSVRCGSVHLARHAIIGAGSVVLPGVTLGAGAAVGAMALVNKSVPEFTVAAGVPIRMIGRRDAGVLDREREFLDAK